MNEEEQEAIEDLKGYLEWNDKRGFNRLPRDNHIEILLNYISKLQKELDKSNNRIDMCIDLLNGEGCLNFDTKQEKLDYIDKLIKLEEEDEKK